MDNTSLSELKSFVLAGGNLINCQAHLCRVKCRRVERNLVNWSEKNPLQPIYLIYLNRLSDVFFVLARYISSLQNSPEFLWDNGCVE